MKNRIYWNDKTPFKTAKRFGLQITVNEFLKLKHSPKGKLVVLLISNGDWIAAPVLHSKSEWKFWQKNTQRDYRLTRVFIFDKAFLIKRLG